MPQPCQVCVHVDRANIDRALAQHRVNVAALARDLGLNAKAMHRHRERHIPSFLPVFSARAQTRTLEELEAEAERLHVAALDALALAEAGTLEWVQERNKETGEMEWAQVRRISHTAIARSIREARACLTQLTSLAGDRPDERGRPTNASDRALSEDIRHALTEVMERSRRSTEERHTALDASGVDVVDAEVVSDGAATQAVQRTRGLGAGRPGASDPTPLPPRQADGTETTQTEHTFGNLDLSPEQIKTAAASIGLTEETFLAGLRAKRQVQVVHPEWTGNPAASREERSAAGYADIEVADNRIIEDTSIHPTG